MRQNEHISFEDLALYAIQSLAPGEAEAARLHLHACQECRNELAMMQGDLALVAMSAEAHPVPMGARERFLARVAAESPADAAGSSKITPMPAQRSVARWVPWAVAAVLAGLCVWLGVRVQNLNRELGRQQAQMAQAAEANSHAQAVLDVLTAPQAQRAVLVASTVKPQPSGRVVYLAQRGGLIFQGSNLAALPADKTYELWVIPANGAAPIPAGLFRPDAAGSASVVLPTLPTGVPAKAFGVTMEKAEGSTTPTAPILLAGAASVAGE
ncbi:MAG TPA: anti-sigma factor [Terracidiphilus sp.]|nr:anti-sigma factor [Terracidiphilus sp.]HEV2472593.1 anti-sigma factor [Chthonomonadales bacterium]